MLQLKPLPTQAIHSVGALLVIILAVIAYLFDEQIAWLFIYDRQLINSGEYWRLLTGHFFHSNGNHLLLNISAVVLIWALHGQYYVHKTYFFTVLICALVCSAGIHWWSLDITQYVGLSGVLHGLFIWGALMDIKHKDKTGYLLLAAVIGKVIHEQIYGASADLEQLIAANVATDAHLYGAIGGLLAFVLYILKASKR
ncbi:rhomboid family GlyGly-CTERM serine protease [Colwellia chukchiensis]|uniref:Rhomboid family GlyGly-CTERM serine protease n=2 Tax=Colwellia chukchiensis TaxID=641665 RepID=A0A1H7LX88_9GAMM|nr:rhomboid family GlyGly-CTERM serine protease [Colwellia chukchiensis]